MIRMIKKYYAISTSGRRRDGLGPGGEREPGGQHGSRGPGRELAPVRTGVQDPDVDRVYYISSFKWKPSPWLVPVSPSQTVLDDGADADGEEDGAEEEEILPPVRRDAPEQDRRALPGGVICHNVVINVPTI